MQHLLKKKIKRSLKSQNLSPVDLSQNKNFKKKEKQTTHAKIKDITSTNILSKSSHRWCEVFWKDTLNILFDVLIGFFFSKNYIYQNQSVMWWW